MATDSCVCELVFQRALRLGARDPAQTTSDKTVGWIADHIEESSISLAYIPFHQAMLRLGLNPHPIRDEDGCLARAELMVPFLRTASMSVDALIVYSTTYIPVFAGAAEQSNVPIINAAYIAALIEERQKMVPNLDPACVWRALLEVALGLLPDIHT